MNERKIPIDELAKRLHEDPAFAAQWRKERDERIDGRKAAYREAIQPILHALHGVGVLVSSLSSKDLQSSKQYLAAFPILAEHLRKPYPADVLWSISTAFAVPEGKPYWSMLVDEYKKWPPYAPDAALGPKAGLANALVATVTKDTIDDLITLAKDPAQGSSRIILLHAIRRSRSPQAKLAVEELAEDPELAKEIASWRQKKPRAN